MPVRELIGIMPSLRIDFDRRMVLHKIAIGKYANMGFAFNSSRNSQRYYSENYFGVPFNISSYALLMHMVAHVCGLQVGDFVYTLGDYHIYRNHVEQVEQLLAREPFPLPRLEIESAQQLVGLDGLLAMRYENLNLKGYQSHGKIAAVVAV